MPFVCGRNNLSRIFVLGVVSLLPSCAVGPDYVTPELQTPKDYVQGQRPEFALEPAEITWWKGFGDQTLNELIEQAVSANSDVLQSLSRINQSRAIAEEAFSELLPGTQLNGSYNKGRGTTSRFPGASADGFKYEVYSGSIDAAWEIDIFGRLRRQFEAKNADYAASVAGLENAIRMVVAEVGKTYFELRGSQAELAVSQANIAIQEETLSIVRVKYEAGAVSELDAAQALTQLEQTRANVPPIEGAIKVYIHRLGVLLGKYPGELYDQLWAEQKIPQYKAVVSLGHPEDLLKRRPDIRAAERSLASYTAAIGMTEGELYPKITFGASIGVEGPDVPSLKQGAGIYSFGPKISWNPLDNGGIHSRIKAAGARAEEALYVYEQTVLRAAEDVENALVLFTTEQRRNAQLLKALDASKKAHALAKVQYQEGLLDLLSVLTTQSSMLQNEDALSRSSRNLAIAIVAIYKALGGGWEAWDLVSKQD